MRISREEEAQNPPLVSVDQVSIEYGDKGRQKFLAVDNVSFAISAGERFVIIGPSGCGKTTLLMAIAGFLPLARGRIRSMDREINGPGPDRAVVFQDFDQLFPWRSIRRNLTYALQVTGRAKGRDAEKIADECLALVQIRDAADRYPHQLSGGMKQRAAIARALAIEPAALLMDEPFGAVDEITRTTLQRELDRICHATQVTLVMVTHSIQEAAFLGDRVMVMGTDPGRIRAIVDTSDVADLDSARFAEAVAELRTLLENSSEARPAASRTGGADRIDASAEHPERDREVQSTLGGRS